MKPADFGGSANFLDGDRLVGEGHVVKDARGLYCVELALTSLNDPPQCVVNGRVDTAPSFGLVQIACVLPIGIVILICHTVPSDA